MSINCVNMAFGGISILVSSDNREFIKQIEKIYFKFINNNSKYSAKIEVEILPNLDYKGKIDSNSDGPYVEVDNKTGNYIIIWHDIVGEFNLKNMEGKIKSMSFDSFESYLHFVYSIILIKNQGFLMHSASLIKNDNGYIFPGKHNAGKTTIARLSKNSTLLNDDMSIVRLIDDQFMIFGNPFSGELPILSENTSHPLKSIYFPIKDNENYIKELKKSEAFQTLLSQVIIIIEDKNYMKELFNICTDFVDKIPAYELHFLPEESFWSCIDAK